MKHSVEQLILAAHVRTLALEIWRARRNALSDKWHEDNPGKERPISGFSREVNNEQPFSRFVQQALQELESVASVMDAPNQKENQ